MEIRALIIDDEPLARNIILEYSKHISDLKIVECCEDAVQAVNVLSKNAIDLIFLDINMPKISGISFLKTLNNPPLVIFTTAYTEYAIESYELNALDYLKKPFSFERFLKAINKVTEQIILRDKKVTDVQSNQSVTDFIFVKSNKKTHKINFNEIQYIEGLGDYIKIQLESNHIITNLTMKKIMDILPEENFFRIHKSFIISLNKVTSIEGNMVQINKSKLPIGNSYRQDFFELVNKNFPG